VDLPGDGDPLADPILGPWPTVPVAPRSPRRPPSERRQRRRAGRRLLLRALAVVAAAVLLPLVLGVAVVVVVGRIEEPVPVPADYRPPLALPQAAVPLAPGLVVFDSDREGPYELYVMDGDGARARPLTADPAFESWRPRLSPDRRTVLFYRSPAGARGRDPGALGLWAVASDGGAPVLLRPPGYDGWAVQSGADWSPDGARLVMAGGPRDRPQLQLTDALGQQPVAITTGLHGVTDPTLQPDGTNVTFVACPGSEDCDNDGREVHRVPSDGGAPVRLTADDRADRDPSPSPDGSRLAWRTQIEGGVTGVWSVVVGGPDGTAPRRLTGDDEAVGRGEWSADGSRLTLHRRPAGRATLGVWSVPLDGSKPRELTIGQGGNNEYPSP
jgi:dipeptidyl aminopeptidase/acylaminoacyl peptidase